MGDTDCGGCDYDCDGCDCDCGCCDWLPCCEGCSGETNVALCCCFFPPGDNNNKASSRRDQNTSAYAQRDCCYYCCCCCTSPTRSRSGHSEKGLWSRICSWCFGTTNVPPPQPSLHDVVAPSSMPDVPPVQVNSTSNIRRNPTLDFLERSKMQRRPEELNMSRREP